MPLGALFFFFSFLFFEDVPLVEFIYCVFTCTPGGVNVGDSGLCCYLPYLLSSINSLCPLIFFFFFFLINGGGGIFLADLCSFHIGKIV